MLDWLKGRKTYIDLEGCGIEDIALDLGTHMTLSRAAI